MNLNRHKFLPRMVAVCAICIFACNMAAARTCKIEFPTDKIDQIDASTLKAKLTAGSEYVESFECELLYCTADGLRLFTYDGIYPSGLVIKLTDAATGYISDIMISGNGDGSLTVNHLSQNVSGNFNARFALNDTVSSMYIQSDDKSLNIKSITLVSEKCDSDVPERPWVSFGSGFRIYGGSIESAPMLPMTITSPGAERIIVYAATSATFSIDGPSAQLYPTQDIKYILIGENASGQSPVTIVNLNMTDDPYPVNMPLEPVTDPSGLVDGARYVLFIPGDGYFARNVLVSGSTSIGNRLGDRYIANQFFVDNSLVLNLHKTYDGRWLWTTDNLNGTKAALGSDGKSGFNLTGNASPSTVTFEDGRAKIDFGNGWIYSSSSRFGTTTVSKGVLPALYRLKSVDPAVSAGTVTCRSGQINEIILDGRTYLTMYPELELTRTIDEADYHMLVSGIDCGNVDNSDLTLAPACLTTGLFVTAMHDDVPVAMSQYNADSDTENADKYPTPWENIRRTRLIAPTADDCRLVYDATDRSITAYVPLKFETDYPCTARITNGDDNGVVVIDQDGLSWYRLDRFIDNVDNDTNGSVQIATTRLTTKITPVIPIAFTTADDHMSRALSYHTGAMEGSQFPIDIELGQGQVSGSNDITAVSADEAESDAEYFTPDGRHVTAPTVPGIYIRRTATAATKVLLHP